MGEEAGSGEKKIERDGGKTKGKGGGELQGEPGGGIGGEVEEEDGGRAGAGARGGPGIEPASPPMAFIAAGMGMASEDIIKPCGMKDLVHEGGLMSMQRDAEFSVQGEFGAEAAFHAGRGGGERGVGRGFAVADGYARTDAMFEEDRREQVDDIFAGIAAMDEEFSALMKEKVHGAAGFAHMVMGVGEDADFHGEGAGAASRTRRMVSRRRAGPKGLRRKADDSAPTACRISSGERPPVIVMIFAGECRS